MEHVHNTLFGYIFLYLCCRSDCNEFDKYLDKIHRYSFNDPATLPPIPFHY